VTPEVAKALRALNATANVATHVATAKAERDRAAALLAAQTGGETGGETGGAEPKKSGVIIGGGSAPGEGGTGGEGGGTGEGSTPLASSAGGGANAKAVESLSGQLPDDFPARDKLAAGAPDAEPPIPGVTTYEQLTKLTKEELDAIPGIGEATIDQIGQRLFADAEKNAGQ
jgi:hypothetical protein